MYIVGVDIGGTFTDAFASGDGIVASAKASTTPANLLEGVMNAICDLGTELNVPVDQLLSKTAFVSHGTTVALNAITTGNVAKVGFITTRGHRDSIYIMDVEGRYAGLTAEETQNTARTDKPDPIIPKRLAKEVSERIDSQGEVLVPLNENDVRSAVQDLLDEKVEAIAVSFLWSFLNPKHELRVREIIHEMATEMYVNLSHIISPRIREYPRSVTTIMSAQVGPSLRKYLVPMKEKLLEKKLQGALLVMQGNGGTISADEADEYPIATIGSVLSGGISGALSLGEHLGHKNIITTDVGGTTFLVGLIVDGKANFSDTHVINKFRLNVPMVQVNSIGSGGGAIVWLDEQLNIRIGPRSAGASPGPACYGEGGMEPTVTDADLLLGILNPDFFLGGRKPLYIELARKALLENIGKPLGLNAEEAAMAVYTIQNAQTSDLVRQMVVQHGYNPGDFIVYSFGGAGPVHCCGYSQDIGVKEVLVPLGEAPAAFSAFGLASSDVVLTVELSDPANYPVDPEKVNANFKQIEKTARERMESQGIDFESVSIKREVDVRFTMQLNQLSVTVKNGHLTDEEVEEIFEDFEEKYETLYGEGTGFALAGFQLINYRVFITGELADKPSLHDIPKADGRPVGDAIKQRRKVLLDPKLGWQETPIYDYGKLLAGHEIEGPAVIETPTTTVVITAETKGAFVDQLGNVIIQLNN
ncbi:MAG: hydantoinase/oxoprolinase family protein [Deltaproteobacteria bacterium]|jgi:N-methylhydantoinase A|nr:hydantoinase/oxoprolinase family protein [Deltaproteobacteria bacterium]MBT4639390.1 hydantoinase/oxoprolinase family protein [Deltaproteobacteria bacterium]MBT7154045.1 hydantoinase/oxoprolinase family protein [Deltaproteobacteria bacterium]MBT7714823.1 hydantoinase/oxoprolinase family protein [Deltaproteobacteria bacterium]